MRRMRREPDAVKPLDYPPGAVTRILAELIPLEPHQQLDTLAIVCRLFADGRISSLPREDKAR